MYGTHIPLYIGGRFYSPGDSFDAPESAVASFLAKGDVYVKESNEPVATEPASPVVEAPVAPSEEPPVETTEEDAPPVEESAPAPRARKKTTGSRKASAKESEEE